jgi:plastocyanin
MFKKLTTIRSMTLATALLLAAGCGGGGDAGSSGGDDAGGAGTAASPVDAATAGNVAGMVTFTGVAPEMSSIDMSDESVCAAKHSTTPMAETVLVGDGGGLANVFVYVKEGLEGMAFPTPAAAVLDQDGCVYSPHVIGVQVGQTLTLRNSDGLLHNIKASPSVNRPFNTSQPVEMDTDRSFPSAEVMVPLQCDVHGWMTAYVGVLDHPYHSVSGGDGAFSLETLPPGDYVIEAWHEQYGAVTQNVTVVTGETADVTFEFDTSMASNLVPLAAPLILSHDQGHKPVKADNQF